jgi:integrase
MGYEGKHPGRGVEVASGKARQVVWSPAQLQAFLDAAAADNEYWHSYFTIVAHTGMRRSNVAAMEWAEITIGQAQWVIPASKFKNKEAHTVHLVPAVLAALEQRKGSDTRWVFPGVAKAGHLVDPYPAFQRICAAAGITGVTIHDLRRTLGSRLAARVPLPVVAKVLGHKTINTTMRSYAVIADSVARDALMALT